MIKTPTFHFGCVTWGSVLGRAYPRAQNCAASICGLLWRALTTSLTSHPVPVSLPLQTSSVGQDMRQLLSGPWTSFWGAIWQGTIIWFPHFKMKIGISSYNEKNVWKSRSSPPGIWVVITFSLPLFALWADKTVEITRNGKVDTEGESWAWAGKKRR